MKQNPRLGLLFSRLPSAFSRAWDRHRFQSFSAGHSCRIRVFTHAAVLAPRTLSSCALSLTDCLYATVPLHLFGFCATLLPPPFPVVRNAVRLMVHVPPDFSMHLWKVRDSNPRCPTLFGEYGAYHRGQTFSLSRLLSTSQPTFLVPCAAILSQ